MQHTRATLYNIGGETVGKYTESKKRANKKWDAAHIDHMSVSFPRGTRDEIKSAAALQGQSVNAYILQAVRERMAREEKETDTPT